jgi:hypothetical protein
LTLCVSAAAAYTPAIAEDRSIVVASTTSTQDSGLFGYLLPIFKAKTGIEVKVIAQGTGQALDTARRGDADVVFVHARSQEEKFLAEGFGVKRFDVMYNDFVLMPDSPTSIGGRFQDLEWNAWVRYARLNLNDTVFTWTGWANGKLWRGPAGVSLPSAALQFISDFQLASANAGPWNWQLGVTPQVNGSLEGKFNSNSLMVDGRAVLLYRASPQWLLAMGAAFWNRATDHLVPYGGVIWAPDDSWELRFMFPKSRASYYLGRFRGTDTWIYAAGEYNLEAYQVDFDGPNASTRGQTSGYRSFAGVTMTTGIWTLFAEAGIVTNRHFRFRGEQPDFTIGDCAFLRSGLLF